MALTFLGTIVCTSKLLKTTSPEALVSGLRFALSKRMTLQLLLSLRFVGILVDHIVFMASALQVTRSFMYGHHSYDAWQV